MKYITFENGMGLRIPLIFPETENHRDIAERFGVLKWVISAGFVQIIDGKPVCYGKSVSLDIPSRADDSSMMEVFWKR